MSWTLEPGVQKGCDVIYRQVLGAVLPLTVEVSATVTDTDTDTDGGAGPDGAATYKVSPIEADDTSSPFTVALL